MMTQATPRATVPKTPAEKQAQARQSQAMTRFGGVLVLFVLVGVPAFLVGCFLYFVGRRNRQRLAILALGLLVGIGSVGLGYARVLVEIRSLQQATQPFLPAVRQLARQPTRSHFTQVQPLFAAVWPHIRTLWLIMLPLAPLIAVHLESSRMKLLDELRTQQEQQVRDRTRQKRREATQKVRRAPDAVKDMAVIGVPLDGDLGWVAKEWAVYSAAMLNRHAVIIGGSGTGKTEFILRVAYLARKVYGWKVFYIDAKGDAKTAHRFCEVMRLAGVSRVPLFPHAHYNGWVGDATTILNRLMVVEDYSEPYYRAVAKTVLTLVAKAVSGPPRTSEQFLHRLHLDVLAGLYDGERGIRTEALNSLTDEHVDGVLRRYFGFFDALGGKLDGDWSFDSVDAAYFLLEGLALKEEARSLGRYLLEDFANYASRRKPDDDRILLIVDEFSALSAGGADAANLFERLRSFGAGIMVTSQTDEGLGDDAKKLIGAAAVTIAFQCPDPKEIAERAGYQREVQSAYHVELQAASGRNPLLTRQEHLLGTSVQREQEVLKLHPDTIRRLEVGECCIIANGAYQTVRVARLPEKPSLPPAKKPAHPAVRVHGAAKAMTARSPSYSVLPLVPPQEREQASPIEESALMRPAPALVEEDADRRLRPDGSAQTRPIEAHPMTGPSAPRANGVELSDDELDI